MCVFVESSDTELAGDCGVRGSLSAGCFQRGRGEPPAPQPVPAPPECLGFTGLTLTLWLFAGMLPFLQ